jgi:lipopolysaccharide cholinephosphotransferase
MNFKVVDFDSLYPDIREEGQTSVRQCQLVMIRMLKIVDHLCNRYQVKYFLTGGTLIGVIRHDGFIPWDDDLDIGMTRDNYEKFVQFVVPQLPNDIFFQNDETDFNYPSCHVMEAKLRDKYSRYCKTKDWHNGLQIDISVYDRSFLPHNFFIYVLNKILIIFFKQKGDRKRARVLKCISKYSPLPLVYSNSIICSWGDIKKGANYYKSKEIAQLKRVKFEDAESYIPEGYDGYLRRRYGNYLQFPPVEMRRGHHSTEIPDPFTPCNHKEILNWKKSLRHSVDL